MSEEKLLTIREVSKLLNVSVSTVWRHVAAEQITYVDLKVKPGYRRTIRFRQRDIDKYIEARVVEKKK